MCSDVRMKDAQMGVKQSWTRAAKHLLLVNCWSTETQLIFKHNPTRVRVYSPKKSESTVRLRAEGRPEGPSASSLLSLRGLGSCGSWRGW